MALLTLWILSTLSPRYDFELLTGIELIMPAAGSSTQEAPRRQIAAPDPAPQPEAVPPTPERQEEAEPQPRPAPPEKDRKRPTPERVSDAVPQPDGLIPPTEDVSVPSKRGEKQQQPAANNPPPQQSDAPDAGPTTAEFQNGIGAGVVDGNALGDHTSWYMARLHGKLASTWAPPAAGANVGVQMTVVHFVITRDGRIENLRVVEGNGNTRFERSVERCVMNASPLPPLPEEIAATSVGVTVPFRKQY
jgi:protein TonB